MMIILYILLYIAVGAVLGGLFEGVMKPGEDDMGTFIAINILLWPFMLLLVLFMLVWKISNKITTRLSTWITKQLDDDD
jgi:hypothetical protein